MEMQSFAEFWPHLVDMAYYGGLVVGVVAMAMVALMAQAQAGAPVQRNGEGRVEPEEAQLHRRRQQGGNVFNEILWQMKGAENRRMDTFIRRLADPDTSEEDRRIYAEQIAVSRNQLDSIDAMLLMKEPDN